MICCRVSTVKAAELTGDEPAEHEGGGERVPKHTDAAEGFGRPVPLLTGAGQAGEQRQRHGEDAHHNQVDGDVGLARTLVQVDGTCGPNRETVTLPALPPGRRHSTLGLTNGNVSDGEDAQRHLGRHCKKIQQGLVCFVTPQTHNLSFRASVPGCEPSPRIGVGG